MNYSSCLKKPNFGLNRQKKEVSEVRTKNVSYPDILQLAGEMTNIVLFLLPQFSFCTHLHVAIAHNKF